ncbi:MAG TPA: hypothetical protein VNL18_10340 [Gemmatimonadales bacterium]|nr:hypothetical protein [Gemmatimonadales bacterium]
MGKKMKAYLPRWMLWIVMPMLVLVWGVITYVTFGTPEGREEPGVLGWLVLTVIVVLVGVMVYLMASGRLPAYILDMDDDESRPSS